MKAMNTNRVSTITRRISGAALAAMLVSGSALSLAGKPASGGESNSGSEPFTLTYVCQYETRFMELLTDEIPYGKRFRVQYTSGHFYHSGLDPLGHPVLVVASLPFDMHINTIPYGQSGARAMISEYVTFAIEQTPMTIEVQGMASQSLGHAPDECHVTLNGILEDL